MTTSDLSSDRRSWSITTTVFGFVYQPGITSDTTRSYVQRTVQVEFVESFALVSSSTSALPASSPAAQGLFAGTKMCGSPVNQ